MKDRNAQENNPLLGTHLLRELIDQATFFFQLSEVVFPTQFY
jgi:hypothetical protein